MIGIYQGILMMNKLQKIEETFIDFLGVPLFQNDYIGYSDVEIQKIKRIYDWKISSWPDKEKQVREHRYNFGKFFKEHDKRRGTDFCKVFPELADFYHRCLESSLGEGI